MSNQKDAFSDLISSVNQITQNGGSQSGSQSSSSPTTSSNSGSTATGSDGSVINLGIRDIFKKK